MSLNVIVPDPLDFQPALETVITILPPLRLSIANTLTCPDTPAANVAVELATVAKWLAVTARLAAPVSARSSPLLLNG